MSLRPCSTQSWLRWLARPLKTGISSDSRIKMLQPHQDGCRLTTDCQLHRQAEHSLEVSDCRSLSTRGAGGFADGVAFQSMILWCRQHV